MQDILKMILSKYILLIPSIYLCPFPLESLTPDAALPTPQAGIPLFGSNSCTQLNPDQFVL